MSRVLVTSALPYVNNIPHLGNLIGATLSADVYARHKRLQGHDVLYVCGADEHGTATEKKAKEEGLTPRELCDKYGAIQKEIYDWFGISFDVWGRTHTDAQEEIVQKIFAKLDENGYIHEREVEQLYDEKAGAYLADRFVEGECPHCGAQGARGDQCDACGKLVTATDLKNPVSKLSGTTPAIKKTTHLFLDLEADEDQFNAPFLYASAKDGWATLDEDRDVREGAGAGGDRHHPVLDEAPHVVSHEPLLLAQLIALPLLDVVLHGDLFGGPGIGERILVMRAGPGVGHRQNLVRVRLRAVDDSHRSPPTLF